MADQRPPAPVDGHATMRRLGHFPPPEDGEGPQDAPEDQTGDQDAPTPFSARTRALTALVAMLLGVIVLSVGIYLIAGIGWSLATMGALITLGGLRLAHDG